ncbi:MAG: M23 family metallopeptidase [Cyanobacteria bacterium REEB67]|nr:M23 family metallopeptidase [Cyanobacteria bacterium REEB67]
MKVYSRYLLYFAGALLICKQSAFISAATASAPQQGAPAQPTIVPDKVVLSEEQGLAAAQELRQKNLILPIQGVDPESLKTSFAERRGTSLHHAVDIAAARNTPVLAAGDGKIARLWLSKYGGNTIYEIDPSGKYAYYYAHLEHYAEGLKEGDKVKQGQVIGFVGTSGDAPPNCPHLHFAFSLLSTPGVWWPGGWVDPYLVFKSQKDISVNKIKATAGAPGQTK